MLWHRENSKPEGTGNKVTDPVCDRAAQYNLTHSNIEATVYKSLIKMKYNNIRVRFYDAQFCSLHKDDNDLPHYKIFKLQNMFTFSRLK